nr:hypothetical protein [Streptomyces antibioticus]
MPARPCAQPALLGHRAPGSPRSDAERHECTDLRIAASLALTSTDDAVLAPAQPHRRQHGMIGEGAGIRAER